ncbi:MAG TPA: hypothetical protein VM513_04115 [Kofleriaceae bacterium]|jgi:hypothetical protein|nr:hypothetical protein [Kofleriaceae bacterium]
MKPVRTVLLGAALAACGDGGGFPDAPGIDSPSANGSFSMMWTIADTGAQVISCDRVGAQSVTAILHERSHAGAFPEAFTCNSGMGSASLGPGIYDIQFELRAPSGLLAMAAEQKGVVVMSGQTTALAPLAFTVDATGGLDLALDTNTTGGNCADTASGGAGITSMTITLEDAVDTCTPVTFAVSAGASGTAGTYVVDCATPATIDCLHDDQRLTVTGVPSGNHQIHVRGNTATTSCWTNDDSFAIPPLGATLTRTLNLVEAMTGCN